MKAEIIAVGSELLTPDRLDTNSLFLTGELNKLGIEVLRKTIVGDNPEELTDAFAGALKRVELVISCGGLGPTADDLTRETVAELLGRKLQRDDRILHAIETRFRRFRREMPEINVRQAMVPVGAEALDNPRGTAPGLWIEQGDRVIVLLPGPPKEMRGLFEDAVAPRLARRAGGLRLLHRELRVTGLGESHVEQRIAPIYKRYEGVHTTVLAAPGEVQVHLRLWSDDPDQANKTLDEIERGFDIALTDRIFSRDGQALHEVVARELALNNTTIAVAESCTGGLLAQRLTSTAGSSSFFLGGVVCYSNERKTAWADVPPELIATKGAVSPEVAVALADGIRRRVGSALGLGVTGIAGPGGGSEEKPVGTVHIALAHTAGVAERALTLPGDRDAVRWQASQVALEIPDAVHKNLAAVRNDFSSVDSLVRWVPPQNFHVTLKFIGGVPKEKLDPIVEALRRVSLVDPVQVCIRGLGWYMHSKTGVMLWAIIEDSKPLAALAACIDRQLASMGFATQNRSFMPHLTLARGSRDIPNSSKSALREIADKYKRHDFGSVSPQEFQLIQSTTLPSGPIYSKVQSFRFAAAGN